MTEIELLKQSLHTLRARFLSGAIGPSLLPCISEVEIRAFETRHSILLPAEYRYFLTIVGNGCVGQLFKLGEMDNGHEFRTWPENDCFVGVLSKAFQYSEAWNDLTGLPDYDPNKEHDGEWLAKYNKQRDLFDERYFKPLDGAIPIADLGCAIWEWLVVTGSERGTVWYDDRSNLEGLKPHYMSPGRKLSFLEWCKGWPNG